MTRQKKEKVKNKQTHKTQKSHQALRHDMSQSSLRDKRQMRGAPWPPSLLTGRRELPGEGREGNPGECSLSFCWKGWTGCLGSHSSYWGQHRGWWSLSSTWMLMSGTTWGQRTRNHSPVPQWARRVCIPIRQWGNVVIPKTLRKLCRRELPQFNGNVSSRGTPGAGLLQQGLKASLKRIKLLQSH